MNVTNEMNSYAYEDTGAGVDPDANNAWSSNWVDEMENDETTNNNTDTRPKKSAAYGLAATAGAGDNANDEARVHVLSDAQNVDPTEDGPNHSKRAGSTSNKDDVETFDVSERPIQISSGRCSCRRCLRSMWCCSCPSCPSCTKSLMLAFGGLVVAQVVVFLALLVDNLDECEIDNFTVEFGMFGFDGQNVKYTSYWEDCTEDPKNQGFDNPSCAFEWRGVCWAILVGLSWILFAFVCVLLLWQEVNCCICKCLFGPCTYRAIPGVVYASVAVLVLAILTWNADSSTVELYVEFETGKHDKGKCDMSRMGLSNWLLILACVLMVVSAVYGCCFGKGRPFRPSKNNNNHKPVVTIE